MTEHHVEVGVIVARRRLRSAWADHAWLPHAVLPAVPPVGPWTPLGGGAGDALFYAGSSVLTLHSAATAHYRANLASGRPALWVALRILGGERCDVGMVTADPYEGEALTEGIGAVVEAVPMPADVTARVEAFCREFHVDRPFVKRRRDRADPEALGRRPPAPLRRGEAPR
jgi:hypothetical protein